MCLRWFAEFRVKTFGWTIDKEITIEYEQLLKVFYKTRYFNTRIINITRKYCQLSVKLFHIFSLNVYFLLI